MATAEATTISRFANAGIGFIVGEIVFLAVAHACGGPPWTIVAMVAFIALAFSGPWVSTLALLAPGLLWLALFQFTGNRELFFPYAMHLAAVVACRVGGGPGRRLAGGGVVIAAFLAIRVAQQATPLVLAVELAVAAAILAATVVVRSRLLPHLGVEAAIVATAGLAAYAGLAL